MRDPEFCKRLRQLRKNTGLSQIDLASHAGVHDTLVSQYESGSRSPGLANLKKLIRGLGCSADDLLGHEE